MQLNVSVYARLFVIHLLICLEQVLKRIIRRFLILNRITEINPVSCNILTELYGLTVDRNVLRSTPIHQQTASITDHNRHSRRTIVSRHREIVRNDTAVYRDGPNGSDVTIFYANRRRLPFGPARAARNDNH